MAEEFPQDVDPAIDPEVPEPFEDLPVDQIDVSPDDVDAFESGYPADETVTTFESGFATPDEVNVFESGYPDPDAQTADERAYDDQLNSDLQQWAQVGAARDRAQLQQTISEQRKTANNGDWRVKLRLAPQADYLYAASDPGPLLQPLKITNGIIFPYTPQIDTQYKANYSSYDLTHSNYRGYFYQNSYVDAINLKCTFTAQSTYEANYLLAVIHFFRSVTKMFYGQDAQRGSPPPLVYLTGLGQYQFNEHSCVVSAFNYSLPSDVDYIRAQSPNINNTNLSQRRAKQSTIGGGILGPLLGGAINRLANAGAPKGGIVAPPPPPNLGLNNPTYVPTKMEISVTMLPVQSRSQISKQFSVKQFANGDLLKGGFW